jgi:hypothetical protein
MEFDSPWHFFSGARLYPYRPVGVFAFNIPRWYNGRMTDYLKRLRYIDDDGKVTVNPLFYPFLFATLIYGLGFTLFGWTSGVNTSSLYGALVAMHTFLPALWGSVAILAAFLAFFAILTRRTHVVSASAAMSGVLLWLFAAITYLQGGYILVILTVALPNMFFWVYWYVRLKWYQRQKAAGLLVDAG